MSVNVKERYTKEVVPELRKLHGYTNPMQVPKIAKIVINLSVDAKVDRDTLKLVTDELGRITGQRPATTHSRVNISNFGLRIGVPLGAKVTLRGARMYDFLDRLLHVALPRIRDFRGVSNTAFDGRGNYTLGLKEQNVFPEIDPDKIKKVQGMDITIVTTAQTDQEAKDLLKLLGMPFAA